MPKDVGIFSIFVKGVGTAGWYVSILIYLLGRERGIASAAPSLITPLVGLEFNGT